MEFGFKDRTTVSNASLNYLVKRQCRKTSDRLKQILAINLNVPRSC